MSDFAKDTNVPTNDCISRRLAIDVICVACSIEEDYRKCEGRKDNSDWCDYVSALRGLLPEESQRKKGKWIYGEDEYSIDGYRCDKCGFFVPWYHIHNLLNYTEHYNFWNFCPCCGADMRGEDDE